MFLFIIISYLNRRRKNREFIAKHMYRGPIRYQTLEEEIAWKEEFRKVKEKMRLERKEIESKNPKVSIHTQFIK